MNARREDNVVHVDFGARLEPTVNGWALPTGPTLDALVEAANGGLGDMVQWGGCYFTNPGTAFTFGQLMAKRFGVRQRSEKVRDHHVNMWWVHPVVGP